MQLTTLSSALADLSTTLAPSVVALRDGRGTLGSGIAIGAERVVTAAHLLRDHEAPLGITTSDGRALEARLVGLDPSTDLAVLAVDGAQLTEPAWRDATSVRPGELALLIGHGPRLHLGVVAHVAGAWRTRAGAQLDAWVEIDATLAPSLVGGATVDAEGKVIGLNTPALTRVGAVIPHSTITRVAALLETRGTVLPGWLGVRFSRGTLPPSLAEKVGQTEVLLVAGLAAGGPAATAGWLPGDAVVAIDGQPVSDLRALQAQLTAAGAGTEVKASLVRAGAAVDLVTRLGAQPEPRRSRGCGPRGC